jgi:hypothetical protein
MIRHSSGKRSKNVGPHCILKSQTLINGRRLLPISCGEPEVAASPGSIFEARSDQDLPSSSGKQRQYRRTFACSSVSSKASNIFP